MEPLHFHRIKLQEYGSTGQGIFKNLPQNIKRLDLLVRECVQNSLDAADKTATVSEEYPNGYVNVCFKTGRFKADVFNSLLSGIADKLNARFSGEQDYIAIRDYYTAGLSGVTTVKKAPLDEKGHPVYSNYLKLVRDIRKNQEDKTAGGSHGVGKTIYSKIGAGVVVYYSRFKNDDSYLSRIAVSLIEDLNWGNCLLEAGGNEWAAGIANWGKADPDNEDNFLPIEDDNEIREFLDIFGIKPYEDGETGTSVIIPFINRDNLLREICSEEESAPFWTKTLESYIAVAVQRWYAPRLNNKTFPDRPCLCFYIEQDNGYGEIETKQITNDFGLFKIINQLYKATAARLNENQEELKDYTRLGIEADKLVCIRGSRDAKLYFDSKQFIGILAHAVCDEDDFKDECGNVISPYSMIDDTSPVSKRKPIVMYTRKPGMIVKYQDPDFMGDITCPEGKYIIALFIPNSSLELTDRCERCMDKNTNRNENDRNNFCSKCTEKICRNFSLEEYLRSTEASDHAGWADVNGGKIVKRIKEKTSDKLNEKYSPEKPAAHPQVNSELSAAIGAIWFPAEDFGTGASLPEKGEPGKNSGKKKLKSGLKLLGKRFEQGKLVLKYECVCLTRTAFINAVIASESGRITPEEWAAKEGSNFPLSITGVKRSGNLHLRNGKNFEYCNQKTAELEITKVSDTSYQLNLDFKQKQEEEELCYKAEIEVALEVKSQKYQAVIALENSTGKEVKNG